MEESAGCGQPGPMMQTFLKDFEELWADSSGIRDTQGENELCRSNMRAIFLSTCLLIGNPLLTPSGPAVPSLCPVEESAVTSLGSWSKLSWKALEEVQTDSEGGRDT